MFFSLLVVHAILKFEVTVSWRFYLSVHLSGNNDTRLFSCERNKIKIRTSWSSFLYQGRRLTPTVLISQPERLSRSALKATRKESTHIFSIPVDTQLIWSVVVNVVIGIAPLLVLKRKTKTKIRSMVRPAWTVHDWAGPSDGCAAVLVDLSTRLLFDGYSSGVYWTWGSYINRSLFVRRPLPLRRSCVAAYAPNESCLSGWHWRILARPCS